MRLLPRGPGWVYVLTNPTLPGCVKIGGTGRTASHRARELVAEYGTASPFVIARRLAVADWYAVEQATHRMLADRRLPRSELFEVTPREAARVIRAAAASYTRPWSPLVWLRRLAMPSSGRGRYGQPRGRQGINRLPMVLLLAALVAGVVTGKPSPASWWPASIARAVLLMERL